ncbi:hypothetical protein D3C87_1952230 [compost metagenome]
MQDQAEDGGGLEHGRHDEGLLAKGDRAWGGARLALGLAELASGKLLHLPGGQLAPVDEAREQ